jgi:Spy/CpxP family protein refolding chaperone
MLRKLLLPTLVATLTLGACDDAATAPTAAAMDDDYALVMFGEPGSALEGTMGPQPGPRPFDGRSRFQHLPDSIALTDEQKAEILALREAFRTEHQEQIDSLKAIFEEARAARQAGATRLEVRAILLRARIVAMGMRLDVLELWNAIWDVLTPEQQAWLIEHRPRRLPPPIAGP